MKREELEKLGMTKEQMDYVMSENGKDINAQKAIIDQKDQQITALTTERDGLKTQVADRDKDIKDLQKQVGDINELTTKLNDLQSKYDKDTAALNDKLDGQARDHAAEKVFEKVEFTSAYAKKAALAEFKAAGLEFKDGAYVGADDFVKKMQTDNPDAFKVEAPPADPEPKPQPKPQFSDPTPQPKPKPKMRLADMMLKKNENPNATINFD